MNFGMNITANIKMVFSYRPLPDCLTIQPSDIDGLGLFAVKNIGCGTNLGVSHIKYSTDDLGLVRTPVGGFINHSERPNCVLVQKISKCADTEIYDLVAAVDIQPGEELTTKYSITGT